MKNGSIGEGETSGILFAGLFFHFGKIDGAAINSDGGSGLKFSGGDPQSLELVGEQEGGTLPYPTAGKVHFADMYFSIEECPVGQDDFTGIQRFPQLGFHTGRRISVHDEFGDGILTQMQVGGIFQNISPIERKVGFVALRSRAPHSRTLGAVQQTELDHGMVGHDTGHAAERINLAHDLSLCDTTDGRVAGHLCDHGKVHCHQEYLVSQSCGNDRRLAACVPGSHHYNIVMILHLFT